MRPLIRRAGDRGLLIELGDLPPLALHEARLRVRAVPGVVACVAGQQSLYVIGDAAEEELHAALESSDAMASRLPPPRIHEIAVSFAETDAVDLPELLAAVGLSHEAFLARIPQLRLVARYLGFRAGFAYLEGWPAEWQLPRRATARPRVPAGSFAIAGMMAGFYPTESPGGWNLLGRTAETLWNPWSTPPNRIAPGDEVRIRPVPAAMRPDAPIAPPTARGASVAEVVSSGQLTMVVGAADERRLELGLATGGAFDAETAATASLAVGNRAGVPLLECVLVGPTLRFTRGAVCAWRGAEAELRVNGEVVRETFEVGAGETVAVGRLRGGLRGWLAIGGGVDGESAPYAVTPRVLRRGDILHEPLDRSDPGERSDLVIQRPESEWNRLRVAAGPHAIAAALLKFATDSEWEVTPLLDRVGIHLRAAGSPNGVSLPVDALAGSGSLPSCGAQFGSIQWHPNGDLVILGPDHPVTGGYLQPFTLRESERGKVARLAPGDLLRLVLD